MDVAHDFAKWALSGVDLGELFGKADTINKAVTILWGAFLLIGPKPHMLQDFCDRVISITTDMGVEIKAIETKTHWMKITEGCEILDSHLGTRIRYEPHKHRTLGWTAAYHAVVARVKGKSKSTRMTIDYKSTDEEFWQQCEASASWWSRGSPVSPKHCIAFVATSAPTC